MKRLNNLYNSICSISNLYEAYSKARKRKSKSYGVKKFEENLDANINQIYCELIQEPIRLRNIKFSAYLSQKKELFTDFRFVIELYIMLL